MTGLEWVPDGDAMRRRPTVVVLHGGPGSDSAGNKGHEIVAALPAGLAEPHLVPGAGHLVMLGAKEDCERIVRDFVLRHSPA